MATRWPPMRPLIRRDAPVVVVGTRSRREFVSTFHLSTSRHRVKNANDSKSSRPSSLEFLSPSRSRGAPRVTSLARREGNRCVGSTQAARRVARNFSNTACVFFSLAGGSSDRPVIGVTSDRALESEKWRSRWAAGDSSCRDRAWTMPGPYAFRAFLSWPGTVSRGCMTRGNTRVWWRTVVIFVFPSRERGESLFRGRVNE